MLSYFKLHIYILKKYKNLRERDLVLGQNINAIPR